MCIDTDYVRESSVYYLNSSCKEINSTDTLFNCYYDKCNMKSTLLLTCLHHKPVSRFSEDKSFLKHRAMGYGQGQVPQIRK